MADAGKNHVGALGRINGNTGPLREALGNVVALLLEMPEELRQPGPAFANGGDDGNLREHGDAKDGAGRVRGGDDLLSPFGIG